MTASRKRWVGPSLLIAAGIVVSTIVSTLLAHSFVFALGGPVIMAVALIGASTLVRAGDRRRVTRQALLLAGSIMLAGCILAANDPAHVALFMPILGACTGGAVGANAARGASCRRAASNPE